MRTRRLQVQVPSRVLEVLALCLGTTHAHSGLGYDEAEDCLVPRSHLRFILTLPVLVDLDSHHCSWWLSAAPAQWGVYLDLYLLNDNAASLPGFGCS